jgi:hypothetical protein
MDFSHRKLTGEKPLRSALFHDETEGRSDLFEIINHAANVARVSPIHILRGHTKVIVQVCADGFQDQPGVVNSSKKGAAGSVVVRGVRFHYPCDCSGGNRSEALSDRIFLAFLRALFSILHTVLFEHPAHAEISAQVTETPGIERRCNRAIPRENLSDLVSVHDGRASTLS